MLAGRATAMLLFAAALLQPYASSDVEVTTLRDVPDRAVTGTLTDALWQLDTRSANAILIESDGYWANDIEPVLTRVTAAGVPVYWQALDIDSDVPQLLRLAAPRRARPGQRIVVEANHVIPSGTDYELLLYANGEVVARQTALIGNETLLVFDITSSGSLMLSAGLREAATGRNVARLEDAATVNVISTPRLLAISSNPSPFAASLSAGGWLVTEIRPRDLQVQLDTLNRFGALILDDVSVNDLPAGAWRAIAAAVRADALGLIALGGPNSFGLGAYRSSVLEELLPLISEPPEDEQPASLILMLDVSGSMDSDPQNALAIAKSAMMETANALRPADRVGLISFDVEARELLPIDARADHAQAIDDTWPKQASGGTTVLPAVELAVSAIQRETAEQKLVVIVTDGMLTDDDVAALAETAGDSGAEFITLLIANDPSKAPLARLDAADNISVLVVDDVLRLPALMRSAVENRRPAVVTKRTTPRAAAKLAGYIGRDWPPLDAYAVTRPRAQTSVILYSDNGDPLFAGWTVGAARVFALPGGLGEWAQEWLSWERWPDVAGELVESVVVRNDGQGRVHVDYDAVGQAELVIDLSNPWAMPADGLLLPENGEATPTELQRKAPRRFHASIPDGLPNNLTFSWEDNSPNRHRLVVTRPRPLPIGTPFAETLVESGVIERWTTQTELQAPPSWKRVLVFLGLLALLLTIVVERVPLPVRSDSAARGARDGRPT